MKIMYTLVIIIVIISIVSTYQSQGKATITIAVQQKKYHESNFNLCGRHYSGFNYPWCIY
jgi:hypothetical protein